MHSLKKMLSQTQWYFDSIRDKIDYLIKQDYIETAFIKKYRPEFLEELYQFIKDQTSNSSLHGCIQVLQSICLEN